MSTFLSLHYHVVFSTKDRLPFIKADWRDRLHGYLGGTVNGLQGIPERIGGIEDHVHMLVGLKATHCLSDFMRELKKATSIWVHEEIQCKAFAWQEGYAAFTVSATACDAVSQYIHDQESHHRKSSFRDELESMLNRAGVTFEPRYLD
jgi:putative transposase